MLFSRQNKTKILFFLSAIGYWLLVIGCAHASITDYKLEMPLFPGQDEISANPGQYVKIVFTYGLVIVGALALFAVAYGGIRYLLSGSSETGKTEGKRWIIGAISGIVLLFASYLILKTINPELISLKDPDLAMIELSAHSGFAPSIPNNELPPYIQAPPGAAANCAEMKSNYGSLINHWANYYGVDPNLVAAIIMQESRGNRNAVSPAGAKGLMQLMPCHQVADPFDPSQNIQAGTKFLSWLIKYYNGNINKALAGYNWGPGNVNKYWPNLPPETQKYIQEVPMWETQCAGNISLFIYKRFYGKILLQIVPLRGLA